MVNDRKLSVSVLERKNQENQVRGHENRRLGVVCGSATVRTADGLAETRSRMTTSKATIV